MSISNNFNFLIKQSYHFELSPFQKQVKKVTIVISLVATACFVCYKAYRFFTKSDRVPSCMIRRNDSFFMPTITSEFNKNQEAFKFRIANRPGGFADISKECVFKFEDCAKIVDKTPGTYLDYDIGNDKSIFYFHSQNGDKGRMDLPEDLTNELQLSIWNSIKKTCSQVFTSKPIAKDHECHDRINGFIFFNNNIPKGRSLRRKNSANYNGSLWFNSRYMLRFENC